MVGFIQKVGLRNVALFFWYGLVVCGRLPNIKNILQKVLTNVCGYGIIKVRKTKGA